MTFDGEAFSSEVVRAVKAYVERQLAPLRAKLEQLQRMGFDLADLSLEQLDERNAKLQVRRGDQEKSLTVRLSALTYRGVFKEGDSYTTGDTATWGGSLWVCRHDTDTKPGTGTDWQLCCKAGARGKDGKDGEPGRPGRDAPGLEEAQRLWAAIQRSGR